MKATGQTTSASPAKTITCMGFILKPHKKQQRCGKNADCPEVHCIYQNSSVSPECRHQNTNPGGPDHGDHCGPQGFQHALYESQVPVAQIDAGQEGDEDTGGEDAAGSGSQGS